MTINAIQNCGLRNIGSDNSGTEDALNQLSFMGIRAGTEQPK
jgi:hypothetical protein